MYSSLPQIRYVKQSGKAKQKSAIVLNEKSTSK